MYTDRSTYNYNNTRAGPSRQSFPPVSQNSYYYDYNTQQSVGPHSGPPERNERMRDIPNQNRQYQNQQFVSSNRARELNYSRRNHPRGSNTQDQKREPLAQNPHRERSNHTRRIQDPLIPDIRLRTEPQNRKKVQAPTTDNSVYICPGCLSPFDCLSRCNQYVGNVPLILNCKHTVCQECIYKSIVKNSVVCPVCKNPSVLSPSHQLENLQEVFSPNFYLLGLILWSKCLVNNVNNMMLVPADPTTGNRKPVEQFTGPTVDSSEKCCFLSCNRTATLHCQDCNDVYCVDCCTVVHKSAKSLWSHKQNPIRTEKGTLDLEKCSEHNMDVEFFCKTCEIGACCYCFIEKHEGHEKDHLSRLDDLEMAMLESYKEKASKILKQLIISQKRLKNLHNCSTSVVEKKISNYFINYHAKLYFLEKNLRKEATSGQNTTGSTKDLDDISSVMTTSIETLKNILAACDLIDMKKLNLKEILNKLGDVINTPCYLINESNKGLDPVEFEVDPVAENIEEHFRIKVNKGNHYSLVNEEELPLDYQKDIADVQLESDAESTMSNLIKSAKNEEARRIKKKSAPSTKNTIGKSTGLGNQLSIQTDIEKVDVTHIESLECFYVQVKKTQYRFLQMNQDIDNYIKMGAATVDQPQLNELYLAQYVANKGKIWCRGRVTEIKNGETEPLYEVFFIDHGSTQTVDITKLREITPSIASKKAFAIQCELQNPTYVNWSKNAHVYMGKMINGKDVFMSVKSINSGIHLVDLMVSSSDGGLTSIIDILIHTCNNALCSSDNESGISQKLSFTSSLKIFTNSMKFTKNQVENVIIANVIDPHHIFVHIAVHAESLKKMTGILKSHYKNQPKSTCIPIEGSYVVVEYKDSIRGNWHRALIKKVDMNTEKAHVMLVDWGLNVVVSWSHIRMLTESFTKLESQAVLVKMAHIEPFQKGQAWSELATAFLQKYFRMQDVLKMIVSHVDPLEVALFEYLGDVDICINAQLVVENFAISSGNISKTVNWKRNDATPKGFTDDEGLVATMLKKADESDEKDESEEDDDPNMIKSKIDVVKFVDASLIYIKFSMYESREHELHKELQVHYTKERKVKESWNEGEDCVVHYHNHYARAKIQAVEEKNRYKVNIYDKPAEVVLHASKIFEYVKYFNKYPNCVFKSHLADIRPAGGDKWSMSSTEALERIFDKYKDIFGTRVAGDTTGKSMPMHMWYTKLTLGGALEASRTKFISINNRLVRLGFAYKQQEKVSTENLKDDGSKDPSAFASVIEKLANKSDSSIDSGTDRETNESKEITSISSSNEDKGVASPSSSAGSKDVASRLSLSDSKEATSLILPNDSKSGESSATLDKDATSAASSTASASWIDIVEEEEKKKGGKTDSPYRTREAEIDDWIPAFPIEKREFNAWITCAENEGYLYLRDENLQPVYTEMEGNIKEYFDNQPPREENHDWQVGQLCTIAYKGSWYRGKVYKVNGPDDIVAVMIDFGSDHNVTAKELNRQIMFPAIPAFATKIKLDRVYAVSGTWLSSDYEAFLEVVSEHAKIVIKGPLDEAVPLAEVFTDKGVNVNQTLVQRCPNLTRSPKDADENSDDDGVVIEEEDVEGVEDATDNSPKKLEKPTTPVDTSNYEYTVEELPEKADTEKVLMSIMAVLSYNKVVVKLTSTAWRDELFLLSNEILETVERLPVLSKFEVGMPCVCPYVEDGIWYRAKIHNIDGIDCSYVFVFFVDYGNVESVPIKDVRMMKPEWFQLPVLCHLADLNVKLKSESHSTHVLEHMKKLFGKNKPAQIVKREPLTVDLYDPDGALCYQSLITNGLLEVEQ